MKKIIVIATTFFIGAFLLASPVYAEGDDDVTVPTDGGFIDEIFGSGGIKLNIMKPINFWNMEGTASVWSIIAYVYSFLTAILFISFLVVVCIGVIKWISSQGQEAQIESAKKWIKNGIGGFVAMIVVFAGVSAFTWLLGVGSVFELGQNLAVCGKEAMYEAKKARCGDIEGDCTCECPEGATEWDCHP